MAKKATGKRAVVYTDGAASGNPGPGGWGAVLLLPDGSVLELGGGERHTTNNRMEMAGAIEALRALRQSGLPIELHTDSSYVVKGITRWIHGWRRRGWLTASKQPVLNRELWETLAELAAELDVSWKIVPGHSGIPLNERADKIATDFAKGRQPELYAGPADGYLERVEAESPPARQPSRQRARRRSGKPLAYISLVDGVWQRHASWAECEARVKGVSGARFQKVMSEDEIAELLRRWGVAQ